MVLYQLNNLTNDEFKNEMKEFFDGYNAITHFGEREIRFNSKLKIFENYTGVCRIIELENSTLCDISFDKTQPIKRVYQINITLIVITIILAFVKFFDSLGGFWDSNVSDAFEVALPIVITILLATILASTLTIIYRLQRDERIFLNSFKKWFEEYL
ncbi:MAG: hypothetical protein ACTSQF_00625 [Candidatus Heimdallarchaeaceae archaeon]